MDRTMMTDEHLEGLLHTYIQEVWGDGNPDAATEFLHDGYRRHLSPTRPPIGRDEQIDRLKGFRAAFPDISIEVEDVIASRDRLAFRSVMRATHGGRFLGIEPTGNQVEVNLLDIWRIADGKVVEHWGGPDIYDLTRQLDTR